MRIVFEARLALETQRPSALFEYELAGFTIGIPAILALDAMEIMLHSMVDAMDDASHLALANRQKQITVAFKYIEPKDISANYRIASTKRVCASSLLFAHRAWRLAGARLECFVCAFSSLLC